MGIENKIMQDFFGDNEEISFIKARMKVAQDKLISCCNEDDVGMADAQNELDKLEWKLFMAGG